MDIEKSEDVRPDFACRNVRGLTVFNNIADLWCHMSKPRRPTAQRVLSISARHARHTLADIGHTLCRRRRRPVRAFPFSYPYCSPDSVVHARLKHTKPWSTISLFRRRAWYAKQSFTILECPTDDEAEREPTPVLYVYLALVALQRETYRAWASVNPEWFDRLSDAWNPDVVSRWMQHATIFLARCPEAFADVLRPRVADACAKARIGACSAARCMRVC